MIKGKKVIKRNLRREKEKIQKRKEIRRSYYDSLDDFYKIIKLCIR